MTMRRWRLLVVLAFVLGCVVGFVAALVASNWIERPMIGLVIGLVFGILAAAAGGLVVQLVAEHVSDDKKAKAVRSMLQSEIDANLEALVFLRAQLTKDTPEDANDLKRADRFVLQARPVWSQGVFSSQTLLLPLALGDDRAKIDAVFGAYDRLARITSIHDALARIQQVMIIADQPHWYQNERERLWRQCDDTISALLEAGNPLGEKPGH